MPMKKLLIRADDLGYSEAVNLGIEKACRDGIVKSVGIMPNMPSVEQGYQLIKDLNLCLGLHTNICVGKPLTDPKQIPSLVQENGEFHPSKIYREAQNDIINLEEVILEIEAQYQKFIEITGIKPHYFEGHAIASEHFNMGLEIVAKKHNCPYLPSPKGNNPVRFKNSLVYFAMDSMSKDYDPFAFLKEVSIRSHNDGGIDMFVAHPGYLDSYLMDHSSLTVPRVREVEMLCDPTTKQWLKEHDVEIITYDDLS